MNLKRGINRLVWTVSILGAVVVLVICEFFYNEGDSDTNFFYGLLTFGLTWLVYGLIIFIYKGFQRNDGHRYSYPESHFWQWVTGRFYPDNDPYQKKLKMHKLKGKKRENEIQLRWEQVGGSFDLKLVNPQDLDIKRANNLLEDVEKAIFPDKNFDIKASEAFRNWLGRPDIEFLSELFIATLSNWAFGEGNICRDRYNNRNPRAEAAFVLWEYLFCANPEGRLTDPEIDSGKTILQHHFDLWWNRQQGCQKEDTTAAGYVNENGQKNLGRVEPKEAGTDNKQYVHVMNCTKCGCIYGSNGTDIFQRKCPICQNGEKGPKLKTV